MSPQVADVRVVRLVVRLPVVRKLRPLRGVQELEGRLVDGVRGFFFLLQQMQITVAMTKAATPPRTEPNITPRRLFAADDGATMKIDPELMFIFMISRPFKMPFGAALSKLEGPMLMLSLPDGSLDGKTISM